jgi:hypothetical protein
VESPYPKGARAVEELHIGRFSGRLSCDGFSNEGFLYCLQAVDGKADLVAGLGKRLCARSSEEASRRPDASSSPRKGDSLFLPHKEEDSGSTTTPFGAALTCCHPHTISSSQHSELHQ